MSKNLVIVESPAKAKTISKYLGPDFEVTSSYGHIRDLPKKNMGIDIDNDFQPTYEISSDKQKHVRELKKMAKDVDTIWLATDEDREGEAIAWHLAKVLDIKDKELKRITFHEITKPAIEAAVNNPRDIDKNLVDAQQARRVLDRLVGYEVSPVLWKKVKPGLSAGRVQSVAVRLIVEREREIEDYDPENFFKVTAELTTEQQDKLKAELKNKLKNADEAKSFVEAAQSADFKVAEVETKPSSRNPGPPFTTSSLQQAAARKLGFSVNQTMTLAQRLYEAGFITYMRTDSVALAQSASKQAAGIIKGAFGDSYHQHRTFKAKQGAQEAHEAIRPTDFSRESAGADSRQKKLYELIRSKALASQMAPAKIAKTNIHIDSSEHEQDFVAKGEVVEFPGFLKVYQDAKIEDVLLPEVKTGDKLALEHLEAKETLKRGPARYSEASLVRKLEEMGIGRPSTYAPTISTIQSRGYIEKGDVEGEEKPIKVFELTDGKVGERTENIQYGRDRNKLLPTQIALLVNDFLTKNLDSVVDYDFTKEVEEEFDRIAHGKEDWNAMIADFYKPFHKKVEAAEDISREEASGAQELGKDPETGKPIIARMGKYGPMLQLGHATEDVKPKFAPIPKGKKLHEVTLEEALKLFELPRQVGQTEDKEEITANYGRYGPYVKAGSTFAPIPEDMDPFTVDESTAKSLIADKRAAAKKREIQIFGDIKVLDGRYGPYVTNGKKNAPVPKDTKPEDITEDQAKELLAKAKPRRSRRRK